MLYGAIIGDMAGSIYEFNNIKYKPSDLLPSKAFFTDDTVMTVAVAEALLDDLDYAKNMRKWAKKYPNAGYGGMFSRWIRDPHMGAYNSYGNGSAMRVSACAWVDNFLPVVVSLAADTAAVTHNHPEGIRGAQATAEAVYLARAGYSKDEIREQITIDYGYDLTATCDQIRPKYYFNETCQNTVPQAIIAFLESNSFEDCIRLGISLGGDSDTLCAIAGAIAEAFYGVPEYLIAECRAKLPADLRAVIDRFEREVQA